MKKDFLNRMNAFILLCKKTTGNIDNIINIFNEIKLSNDIPAFKLVIFLDCFEVVPKEDDSVITVFTVLKRFRNDITFADVMLSFSIKLSEEDEMCYTARTPISIDFSDISIFEEGQYAFSAYRIDGEENTSTKTVQQVIDEGELIGETLFNVVK